MDYTIRGQKRSIHFSTDLIVGVYETETQRCRFDVSDRNDLSTILKVDFQSDYLHVLMFDNQRFYVQIWNDNAMDEIKEKLTENGIEVREHEF